MYRWTRRIFAFAAVAAIAACGMIADAQAPDEPVLNRDEFIEVYVALRSAAAESTTRWDFDARKQAILDERGVTWEELAAFLETHHADVAFLASVWTEIERRLREHGDRPQ